MVISERDKESTYTRGLLHSWVGGSCTSLAYSFAHDQAHAPEACVHIYTVVRGKILPDLKVSSDNNDTEMKSENDTSSSNMKMYKVRIEKIFKGTGLTGGKKHVEVMVSRFGETCGVPLQEKEVYVLTGKTFLQIS